MLDKIEIIRQVEKKIKNNDFKGALGDITKCLELYPNFIVAKVLKAECLLKLDNAEEALALTNEVLFSAPDNIKARKIAVEANLQVGNVEEAKSHVDFLSFLLPANHPYLEEIKKRLDEEEGLQKIEEESGDFEIERTGFSENKKEESQVSGEQNVQVEKKESLEQEPVVGSKGEDKDEMPVADEIIEEAESNPSDDFLISSQEIDDSSGEKGIEEKASDEQVEEVNRDEIVTGVLQEQISTVTLPEKREEPEIKTRTLALIYERQGMFQEALEILENLFEESQDMELLKDIERIKIKLKGGNSAQHIVKKIKILENWLERIKWHSSN